MSSLFSRFGIVVALVGVLSACAGSGMGGSGENNVRVEVDNNLIPSTSLSVYAVPDVGSRRLVGIVRPGQSTTLSFNVPIAATYRFVGETTEGREVASTPITLSPGDVASWDVSTNVVVPAGGQ